MSTRFLPRNAGLVCKVTTVWLVDYANNKSKCSNYVKENVSIIDACLSLISRKFWIGRVEIGASVLNCPEQHYVSIDSEVSPPAIDMIS